MSIKFKFTDFEEISETSSERLIGGFSASFSINKNYGDADEVGSNNCAGGNCASGCGTGQNIHCPNVLPLCGA